MPSHRWHLQTIYPAHRPPTTTVGAPPLDEQAAPSETFAAAVVAPSVDWDRPHHLAKHKPATTTRIAEVAWTIEHQWVVAQTLSHTRALPTTTTNHSTDLKLAEHIAGMRRDSIDVDPVHTSTITGGNYSRDSEDDSTKSKRSRCTYDASGNIDCHSS